ncbi:methylmalonyl-CoA mutase [Roseibium aquae]|uniref:Methylmalonyl-CoA mutase n=1 Tax=Roseibium aquae TaxID=1323746 RepID=A0A916X211_9HYPH|nr:methylmalonyl-CoA mutase subunit beta [Roseibium aquae]GGB50346.1 methylmalonyl-CoA mutase [Roseibium aquae]
MTDLTDFEIPEAFLGADRADWLAAVDAALKGASRDRLQTRTEDGYAVEPLYPKRSDAQPQMARPAGRPWSIIQRIDHPDVKLANAQILDDLEGGASGLELVFASSSGAQPGGGICMNSMEDMDQLLSGVYLDLIDLRLVAGHEGTTVLPLLVAYLDHIGLDPSRVRIHAGFDYYGLLARRGWALAGLSDGVARAADAYFALSRLGATPILAEADGRPWHDGGASAAQELGCVLATGVEYLRAMEHSRIDPARWAALIGFTLVADADQIGTVAKARALRRLWSCVLSECGLEDHALALHMQTSHRMLTARDPFVNLLRNTVAAFSAGIGGADSVAVLPHTSAVGLPDAFARRLARNTQSILIEESNLHKVADPSAGSGAIEARTGQMADAAWAFFQEIEAKGGLGRALEPGFIQDRLNETRAERARAIASRKRPVTGVSEFPDLEEKPVLVLDVPMQDVGEVDMTQTLPEAGGGARFEALVKAFKDGARVAELQGGLGAEAATRTIVRPLDCQRDAEPFEALRRRADHAMRVTGRRPAVFLACLGPLAEFTARATWTKNALAAGGLASAGGEPVEGLDSLVAQFKQSGARLACLVSSDRVYAEQGPAAATALKAAGAAHLYLAGRPGEQEEPLRAAGVDSFLYAGGDLLTFLQDAHRLLGLAEDDASPAQEDLA